MTKALPRLAAYAAAVVVLFCVYLRLSDMLHGNVLLSGWHTPALDRMASTRLALVSGMMARVLAMGGYLAGFGYELGQPYQQPQDELLASWLVAHHLDYGLAGYWDSSSVTVDSGGRVAVRAVNPATLTPDLWMSDGTWYDPKLHDASFLILDGSLDSVPRAVRSEFGAPRRSYHVGEYTIFVWNANLLR